jgi:uncharacterized protein YqeY
MKIKTYLNPAEYNHWLNCKHKLEEILKNKLRRKEQRQYHKLRRLKAARNKEETPSSYGVV